MKKKFILINSAIFFIIIFIIIGLNLFVNISVINNIKKTKDSLLADIQKKTGYEVEYSRMSPTIFSKIRIHEVVIKNVQKNAKLSLGDIEVSFSLIGLITHLNKPISFIKRVSFRTLNLKVSKDYLIDLIKDIIKIAKTTKGTKFPDISNFTIDSPSAKIEILDKNKKVKLNTKQIEVTFKHQIYIRGIINTQLFLGNKKLISFNLKSKGTIFNNNDVSTLFNINFDKIIASNQQFKEQNFIFESNASDFKLYRLNDILPISMMLKKENNKIIAKIKIQDLPFNNITIGKINFPLYPSNISFSTNLDFDLKNKKTNGEIKSLLYFNNFTVLKNSNLKVYLIIKDNVLSTKTFKLYNFDKDSYLHISGTFPFPPSNFDINVDFNDFKLPKTKINTSISIRKRKKNINIKSKPILLNDDDIGEFAFRIIKYADFTKIITDQDFNGYSISGFIKKDKNNKIVKLTHDFNNFSISKIINAFNKKNKHSYILNSKFSNIISNKKILIKKTEVLLTKDDSQFVSCNFSMYDKIFSLNDFKIGKDSKIKINTWLNFKSSPIVLFVKAQIAHKNVSLYSEISNKKIAASINKKIYINFETKSKNIFVRANKLKIPFIKSNMQINFNFAYNIAYNKIWKNTIYIQNINIFKDEIGNFSTQMEMHNGILSLKNMKYQDKNNLIQGELVQNITNKNFVITGNGFLNDENKGESYSINYKIDRGKIDSKIYVTHMEAKKILGKKFEGFLNMQLSLFGKITNPEINFNGEISDGKLSDKDFTGYFVVNKKDSNLNIKAINLELEKNRLFLSNSTISLNSNKKILLNLNGSIYLNKLSKWFKTDFQISGPIILKKNFSMDLGITFKKTTLAYLNRDQLVRTDIPIEKYSEFAFRLHKENDKIVFFDNQKKVISFMKEKNNFKLKIFNDKNTILNGNLSIEDGNLDGLLTFSKFPVNVADKIVSPFVRINAGLVDGNLYLRNKLSDPKFEGQLNLYYGEVNLHQYLQDNIKEITGQIIVKDTKLYVNNVNAVCRKGLIHGFGEINFDKWKFLNYHFEANSEMVPALFKSNNIDAYGSGDVKKFIFEGKPKYFAFIGDIFVNQAEVNLGNFLKKGRGLKQNNLYALINITAGKKIKVNYPIMRGTLKEGGELTIKYIGNEPAVYLGGTLELKNGGINYLDKSFRIQQASVQFFENESKINPIVNLKSYFRTRDTQGNPVKVFLTSNDRLLSLKTEFSAFPYKSQEEINGLLGLITNINKNENLFGFNTQDESNTTKENNQDVNSLILTTNYLSNSLIFAPIENQIKKITGLDTFNLHTDFFGNIISSNLNNTSTNLFDLLDNSSLTLGKYIFDSLYFESGMSFHKASKTDFSEKHFIPLQNGDYGLDFKIMLQLELQNFSLAYSYSPKDYKNFLDADQNVSFEAFFRL